MIKDSNIKNIFSGRAEYIFLALLFALTAASLVVALDDTQKNNEVINNNDNASAVTFQNTPDKEVTPTKGDNEPVFPAPDVRAQAAIVYDIQSQTTLYEKNPDAPLPLASITKLMTAYTAANLFSPDKVITIPAEALAIPGDSGLIVGEKWRLKDLLSFMLITSSNDATYAVNAAITNKYGRDITTIMNNIAASLGMTKTRFYNESGLDITEFSAGAYGSARNVVTLVEHILKQIPEYLDSSFFMTTKKSARFLSLSNQEHIAINTNPFIASFPSPLLSKTGLTEIAGGNLVIAFEPEPQRPIVIVVLGSTFNDRYKDVSALADATITFLTNNKVIEKND